MTLSGLNTLPEPDPRFKKKIDLLADRGQNNFMINGHYIKFSPQTDITLNGHLLITVFMSWLLLVEPSLMIKLFHHILLCVIHIDT